MYYMADDTDWASHNLIGLKEGLYNKIYGPLFPLLQEPSIDDSAKEGLTQFRELFTVIPCAPKDYKRL